MASDFIDSLKERFGFDDWAMPETRDVNVFLLRFHPANVPLPQWTLQHAVVIEAIEPQPKGLRAAEAKKDVRATDAVWTQGDDDARALHVTTYECASREDARLQLLRVLSELQSPIVERADKTAGEVAFQMPKKTMTLFARGNLVVLMRNAGEKVANVAPTARALDEQLTSTPPAMSRDLAVSTSKASVAVGKRVTIALPKADAEASVKIVARGGEVRLEKDQPVYEPHTAGEHDITVVTMRGGTEAAARTTVKAK